jgi:hypothetical protein
VSLRPFLFFLPLLTNVLEESLFTAVRISVHGAGIETFANGRAARAGREK